MNDEVCPASAPWALLNHEGGLLQCYLSEEQANEALSEKGDLDPAEQNSAESEGETRERPPRDELVRSMADASLRQSEEATIMEGRFTPFNEWTEIHSSFEGHFMERIAPGAFRKSFEETTPKVLFQHGMDMQLGEKPLGKIRSLEEKSDGPYFEVEVFDGVDPLLLSGIRAGEYGASFRFRVLKEDYVRDPKKTSTNPEGIPERTITEAQVFEFGPVTFPAYEGATVGIRSLTDPYLRNKLGEEAVKAPKPEKSPDSTPQPEPEESTPAGAARKEKQPLFGLPQEEEASWRL